MLRSPTARLLPTALLVSVLAVACGGDTDRAAVADSGSASASSAAAASPATTPLALTDADLDLYERGLKAEIDLVRAAQARASTATTPQARGEASQAQWKEQTMPAAARAIGAPPERYQQVRDAVHEVLQTLDFQGKIEGPMQMDTSRATPEMRARLARDPLAELPAASAAALRARLDRLAPIFAQYVTLTAVGG